MDFEAILNQPLRWPKAGDRLFQNFPRREANAEIADGRHNRMVLMMSGYKLGADLMVRQASDHQIHRNTLVFPIIFNYRQYLELSLKYLIATYGRTVGVDEVWSSHDLSRL